jgi:16S rRNA (guanine527-N7)-methyltransferase
VKHTSLEPASIVSRETAERLKAYTDLLLRWNRTINLISKRDEADFWRRHVEDALQLQSLLPANLDRFIDLGSGAGIPGLILAIASGAHVDLIESDHRKSAFLLEAIRVTGAPAQVHTVRIEDANLTPVKVVTARALAPLVQLVGMAERFLLPGGFLVAPKGQQAEAELTAARAQWHMTVDSVPSKTSADATILKISEVRRVGHEI